MTSAKVFLSSFLATAVSVAAPRVYAQTFGQCQEVIFGVDSNADSLTIFDPVTGSQDIVGPVNRYAPIGIGVHPSDAQIFVWDNSSLELLAVDRCTAWGTSLGFSGLMGTRTVYDLVVTPDERVLGLGDLLVEFDLATGRAIPLGDFINQEGTQSLFIGASAYAPHGRLFAIADSRADLAPSDLGTLDLATRRFTSIARLDLAAGAIPQDIIFDAQGRLYLSNLDTQPGGQTGRRAIELS